MEVKIIMFALNFTHKYSFRRIYSFVQISGVGRCFSMGGGGGGGGAPIF